MSRKMKSWENIDIFHSNIKNRSNNDYEFNLIFHFYIEESNADPFLVLRIVGAHALPGTRNHHDIICVWNTPIALTVTLFARSLAKPYRNFTEIAYPFDTKYNLSIIYTYRNHAGSQGESDQGLLGYGSLLAENRADGEGRHWERVACKGRLFIISLVKLVGTIRFNVSSTL